MEDGPSNSKTEESVLTEMAAARSGRQEASSSEDYDAVLRTALSAHATSFHELGFREPEDDSEDEDNEVSRFRRTFSQCDSPGDPVPDDALTAKSKDEKCSEHEKNLRQFLEDSSAWRKVARRRLQPTPCKRVVKSDGEMANFCDEMAGVSSALSKLSFERSSSAPPVCSSDTRRKQKWQIHKLFRRLFKFGNSSTRSVTDSAKPSSVNPKTKPSPNSSESEPGTSDTAAKTSSKCEKESKPRTSKIAAKTSSRIQNPTSSRIQLNPETKSSPISNESEPRTSKIAAKASSKYEKDSEPRTSKIAAKASSKYKTESEESDILQKITSGTGTEGSESSRRIVDSDKSKPLPENSPDSCDSGKSEASLVIDLGESNSSKDSSPDDENNCGSGKSESFLVVDSTKSNSSLPVSNVFTSRSLEKSETSPTYAVKSTLWRENTPGTKNSCSSEQSEIRRLKDARLSGPSTSETESSCSSEERHLKDARRSGPSTSGTESSCSSEERRVNDARRSGPSTSGTESSCSSEDRRLKDARLSGLSTSGPESSCISRKSDLPTTLRKSDSNTENTLVTEASWSSENSEVSRILEADPSVSPSEYYSSSVETSSSVSGYISETCASADTDKQNSPPLLTSRPPAPASLVIKVPTKMAEFGAAYCSPKQVTENTLPGANTRRPMDFNVKRRSAFYTFSPSSPTNFIIRPYRSLPNVYRPAGHLATRRSAGSDDSKRRVVRSLFTGNFNPDQSAPSSGGSATFSRTSASQKAGSTKRVPQSSSQEQNLPENSSKVTFPNPKACKRLTFTPAKDADVTPTFQRRFNLSSSGQSATFSKISASQSQKGDGSTKQVPHGTSQTQNLPENSSKVIFPNPKACKRLSFTPAKETRANLAFQSPGESASFSKISASQNRKVGGSTERVPHGSSQEQTLPENSSKVTCPNPKACKKLSFIPTKQTNENQTFQSVQELSIEVVEEISKMSLYDVYQPPEDDAARGEDATPKRKVTTSPIITECCNLPLKKARPSAEFDPEGTASDEPGGAAEVRIRDVPSHASRGESVSPKRKVEDVSNPEEVASLGSPQSASKRTRGGTLLEPPPDHGSRKSLSPKRKVEEVYVQNPDVVPPEDERSRESSSESALKRTKIKPPSPTADDS